MSGYEEFLVLMAFFYTGMLPTMTKPYTTVTIAAALAPRAYWERSCSHWHSVTKRSDHEKAKA